MIKLKTAIKYAEGLSEFCFKQHCDECAFRLATGCTFDTSPCAWDTEEVRNYSGICREETSNADN